MVVLALTLPRPSRDGSLRSLGWRVSRRWVFIAVLVGVCVGFGNPGGFDPTLPVAVCLALFHTFATELFFRGYLFRTLAVSLKREKVALVLSSFLYGLSYLTVSTTWGLPLAGRFAFVALFTFLGLLFAWSYRKSGSILVPWMMHFFGVLKYRVLF